MPVMGLVASAQNSAEYQAFMQASGYKSVLFRGKVAQSYSGTPHNGTYYWSSPEFKLGSIMYNGKLYEDVFLNIDANTKDVLVRSNQNSLPVALNRDYVDYFNIGDDRFINLQKSGYPARIGFYQIIKDGDEPIYLYVSKSYMSSTDNVNGDEIGYVDENYNAKLFKYFGYEARYYMYRAGKLKKIGRNKALKLAYGN